MRCFSLILADLVISGARFGFTLDEELKVAAADNDVKAAIADKISRERIGHEVRSFCCLPDILASQTDLHLVLWKNN